MINLHELNFINMTIKLLYVIDLWIIIKYEFKQKIMIHNFLSKKKKIMKNFIILKNFLNIVLNNVLNDVPNNVLNNVLKYKN